MPRTFKIEQVWRTRKLKAITSRKSRPFDLDLTLSCGQTFRWRKKNGWWYGIFRDQVFKVRQNGETLEYDNIGEESIGSYLGLNDDMPSILSQICRGIHMKRAVDKFRGLHILRQDPWESLISYICATYKNIAAIERMLLLLSKKFGRIIHYEGQAFNTFPTPSRLAKATQRDLAKCELGYRAKYISQTAKKFTKEDYQLEALKPLPYDEAKSKLLDFPGVGQKVADCVLLFSLEKLEAFPVDVWIKRAILKHYRHHFPKGFTARLSQASSLSDFEYRRISDFGRSYFGKYAGYAQEYLYHYERTLSRR